MRTEVWIDSDDVRSLSNSVFDSLLSEIIKSKDEMDRKKVKA